jgi:ion channel-forming bestrophin family protein
MKFRWPLKFPSARRFVPRTDFWAHVFDWDGEGEQRRVLWPVVAFFLFAELVWFVDRITPKKIDLGIGIGPYEFAGAILGSLLVLRTNSGLERWWEGRRLWGSITNQSRNLAIIVLANGPDDPRWRRDIIGWIAAFGHVTRRSLRRQKTLSEIEELVGVENAEWIAQAEHKPTAVALKIAEKLRAARDSGSFDSSAFLRAEEQRAWLIDHVGGCERILKTPLATAYVVLIRRFIVMFLVTLPFALLRRAEWATPFVTVLVAYPILALDHIADDLQRPFSTRSINHLPLNDITTTIETNLLALIPEADEDRQPSPHLTRANSGD